MIKYFNIYIRTLKKVLPNNTLFKTTTHKNKTKKKNLNHYISTKTRATKAIINISKRNLEGY